MKAIIIDSPGGPEKLKIGEADKPIPQEDEVLVKVEATALNRADLLQREGKYPVPKGASEILGMEISGTVAEIGSNVKNWKKDEKVFGLIPGGGYAEYAIIHKDIAMKIPDKLKTYEAAAIPEVFLTAYQAIFWNGKLNIGETVLIHAGASGVGTAAIQIAKNIGCKVFVTASKSKHTVCFELGADAAIDYKSQNFDEEIMRLTKNKGVDLIIDFIGADYYEKNINSLNYNGRLVILATMGGTKIKEVDLRKIMGKWLTIIGSMLRSRDLDYRIKLTKEFSNYAIEKFKTGQLKPVIDKIFDWKDVAEAHIYMEQNKNIGKIVLKIS
jgi:putative PIG3 family NAD(P)H quinone oxidoreductase